MFLSVQGSCTEMLGGRLPASGGFRLNCPLFFCLFLFFAFMFTVIKQNGINFKVVAINIKYSEYPNLLNCPVTTFPRASAAPPSPPGPAPSFSARAGWPHGGSRVFPEPGREVPPTPTALGFCPVSGWQCSLPRAGEPGDA